MRFMLTGRADKNSEAGLPPRPELMEAIGKMTVEMVKSGTLVETGGLMPSSQGARLSLSGGKVTVVDGPYAEAKELIGGYAVVDVKSREEAVAIARKFLEIHARIMGPEYETESEVRQMYDLAAGGCGSQREGN